MAKEVRNVKIITRYSEALKRKVAEEVESGNVTVREAVLHYGVGNRRTVQRWVWKYGKQRHETKIVRVVMKNEQERIRELERLVADLTLRNEINETQLEIYAELVPDFKKKLNSKQLKDFEERERKLKSYR